MGIDVILCIEPHTLSLRAFNFFANRFNDFLVAKLFHQDK